jgi:hypothetical protein
MRSFKDYITEATEVHPELAQHGIDHESVKKFIHMRKSELDGSGLETRGEKMKATRAKTAFFNHLKSKFPDEQKMRVAHSKIADRYDYHGEKGMYK